MLVAGLIMPNVLLKLLQWQRKMRQVDPAVCLHIGNNFADNVKVVKSRHNVPVIPHERNRHIIKRCEVI